MSDPTAPPEPNPPAPQRPEPVMTAWVIVRDDSSPGAPIYWSGLNRHYSDGGWSHNHQHAVRFAQMQDAEKVASEVRRTTPCHVEEHSWFVSAPPLVAPVQRPEPVKEATLCSCPVGPEEDCPVHPRSARLPGDPCAPPPVAARACPVCNQFHGAISSACPGPDPLGFSSERLAQGEADVAAGRVVPFDQVVARLRVAAREADCQRHGLTGHREVAQ